MIGIATLFALAALLAAAPATAQDSAGPQQLQEGQVPAQQSSESPADAPREELQVPSLEPSADQGAVLTFQEALRIAATQNLDLKVAAARLEQSQLLSRRVWANYLPTISVGGSYTRNNAEAKFALPPPIGTGDELVIQPFNQWGAQAQVSQALIAPALWPAIKNSYLAEEVAELSVENVRREVLFGVAQAYFGAAALRQSVEVQVRLLENATVHEKDARVRFEAGAAPKIQLIRAQIDRARAEQDLVRSQNSLASAKLALATLLGRKEADFQIAPPDAGQLVNESEDLQALALEQRIDLQVAQKNLDLAEAQRTAVWFQYLPTLGLNGVYRWSNVGGFSGENTTWALTLGLNWVLWDGGLREVNAREASSKIIESRTQLSAAELKANQEIRQSLLDLQSARANRTKAEEQLKLARENMQLVDVNYTSGVATQLDVSDAQAALAAAERGLVAERLNADLSVLRLAKAAGVFTGRPADSGTQQQ